MAVFHGRRAAIASRDIDESLPKIRRFALIVGSVLVLYVLAGVQAKAPITVTAFGLVGFEIVRPQFVTIGLVALSAWSMLRYFYYGHILSISPIFARRLLRRGKVPGFDLSGMIDSDAFLAQGRSQAIRYFPVRGSRAPVQVEPASGGSLSVKVGPRSLLTKVLALWESLDYSAPLWLNALGMALLLTCRSRVPFLPWLCP